MSLVLADRVKDTTTTTGTGTVTLANSAPTGYRTFGSVLVNGDTTYYCIVGGAEWEVGLGTYSTTGPSLVRTAVLSSSNSGSLVNFSVGTKDIFVCTNAEVSVIYPSGGNWSPAVVSWVADIDPDAISANDGDALASVPSGGSADAFVQASGTLQPLLKKGVNGCNGHNVILADGTNDVLATTTGGAALSGDWYIAAVVNLTATPTGGNVQDMFSWGNDLSNQRRQWLIGGPTFWNTSPGFVGNGTQLTSNSTIAAGTWYFLEAKSVSGIVTLYKNGTQIATGAVNQQAYSSTVLRLFTNPSGSGEALNGKLARLWAKGSIPSANELGNLRGYVANRFGITVAGGGSSAVANLLTKFTAAGQIIESAVSDDGSTVLVGGRRFWAVGSNNPHVMQTSNHLQNTLFLQNTDSDAYSCVVCLAAAATVDGEVFSTSTPAVAFGWGTAAPGAGAADVFSSAGYMETSDFSTGGFGNVPPPLRLVTTGRINGVDGNFLRVEAKSNGDTVIYKSTAVYGSHVAALTISRDGNIVPGSTTLATNATDGFQYLPTCAGTPTGTPTAYTGRVAMVYDTTAHKIWVYDGGTWKATASLS